MTPENEMRKFWSEYVVRLGIFEEVNTERERQYLKWGEQKHDIFTWLAILGEEVGECNKAALDARFEDKVITAFRKEMVQVAAVCFQIIEAYDKGLIVK